MAKNTPRKINDDPIIISIVNTSSKMSMPSEMLDTGTKYVTNEAFNEPIRLINLIKITYANEVLITPNNAI